MATTTKSNRQYCDNYASIDANIGPWDSIEAYTTWLSSELGIDEPLEGTEILIKGRTGSMTKYRYEIVNDTASWKVTGSVPIVTNADTLNTQLSYGIYFLTSLPRGILTVSWDYSNRITQHLLASCKPVYTNGVIVNNEHVQGACVLTRYYSNNTWSNWETSIPTKVSELDNDSGYITSAQFNALVDRVTAIENNSGSGQGTITLAIAYTSDSSVSSNSIYIGEVGTTDKVCLVGEAVSVTAAEVTNNTFVGWYNSSNTLLSTDAEYNFYAGSVNTTIYAKYEAAEETAEEVSVTMLGKYSVSGAIMQGDTVMNTTGAYNNSNGISSDDDENITFYEGSATLSHSVTVLGETVTGWRMNGVDVTSPVTLTGDSIITPVVKGNIVNFKGKYPWSWHVNNDVWIANSTNTKEYHTNFFPIMEGQTINIYIPNHAGETVSANMVFGSVWGVYKSDKSGLLSITLDENSWGTYTSEYSGYVALNPSYASDGSATVFSEDDIKGIQINYADTTAFGIPTFYYKKIKDLGTIGTTTWPQSSFYYNGYLVIVSNTMSKFIVVNTETDTIVKTFTNSNADSDLHCNSASVLPIKYSDTDFYPLILLGGSSAQPGFFAVVRLNGTSATSFTVETICKWTFTGASGMTGGVSGNNLYFRAYKYSGYDGDVTVAAGIYKLPLDLTDLSTYVDTTFNLPEMVEAGTAVKLTSKISPSQDWEVIVRDGYDDLIMEGVWDDDNLPANYFGFEFIKTDGTTEGTKIVGILPLERIFSISTYEVEGISYVGNGVFYITMSYSQSGNYAELYKFTMTFPEYTSTGNG